MLESTDTPLDKQAKAKKRRQAVNSAYYRSNTLSARQFEDYIRESVHMNNERKTAREEDIERLCENSEIHGISYDTKRECFIRGSRSMSRGLQDRFTCTICNRGYLTSNLKRCNPEGKTALKWVEKLSSNDEVSESLRNHYTVAEWFPELKGALLSKRGVLETISGSADFKLLVCQSCCKSMKNGSNPPNFSIANGFFMGELPKKFSDARPIEKRLTSLTSIAHSVIVLRGGRHKTLKGHVSIMRMNPSKIRDSLPRLLNENDEYFLVVIASNLTPVQKIVGMRRHLARTETLRSLLEFFMKENILYQEVGVSIDKNAMETIETHEGDPGIMFETEKNVESESPPDTGPFKGLSVKSAGFSSETMTDDEQLDDHDTYGLLDPAPKSKSVVEEGYSETTSIYVENNPHTSVETLQEAQNVLLVRNNGPFISFYEKKLLGLCVPDLFPYGCAHPGTSRKVPVSLEECCRYYLSLASRKFAQHSSFLLIAFDICGRRIVVNSTCIRSLCRPGEFVRLGNITREELSRALQEKRLSRECALMGKPARKIPFCPVESYSDAESLLRHIRVSQSCMWGSAEEKLIYRRKAFSMDAFLKTGALFVTITPSDTGNLCVTAIAGRVSHNSILQLEENSLPSRAERASLREQALRVLIHWLALNTLNLYVRHSSQKWCASIGKNPSHMRMEGYSVT